MDVEAAGRGPLVSIGVPVHQGECFLDRAVTCLLAQDHRHLELIIADNGSTDRTAEIAGRWVARDPRVQYHPSDSNRGAAWNFNRTVALARGRYFKWASHDDECEPSLVSRCVEALEADSDVVLAYARTTVIDADGRVVPQNHVDGLHLDDPDPHRRFGRLLRNRVEYHPVFGVMRLDVLRRTRLIGAYVESDAVLLAEMALAGRFHEVPDPLFRRRLHPATSVSANPGYPDRARWFDPSNDGRLVLPRSRVVVELVRAVMRADLTVDERACCFAAVARDWVVPWRRAILEELPRAVVARTRDRRRWGTGVSDGPPSARGGG